MKTVINTTRAVLLFAFALTWVPVARGQPLSPNDSSVELMVARTHHVVRAVVEDIAMHDLKDGLYRHAGNRGYRTVSMRVLETLKGKHSDRLQFVVDHDSGPIGFADVQKNNQEVLLFLEPWVRSERFNRSTGGYAHTRFPLVIQYLAVLHPENVRWAHTSMPMLSSNLTHVKTAEQLLSTIRSYLKSCGDDHGPVVEKTVKLPDEWNPWGLLNAKFTFPLNAAAADGGPDSADREAVLDFEEFKRQYAKPQPPAEKLMTYDRKGKGYVGVDSLELMATDCDTIVRGVIEDFCFVGTEPEPTLSVFGVKLRVLETLKGKCPERIGVYVSYPPDLGQLRCDRQEIVVFMHSQRLSGTAKALGYQARQCLDRLWDDSAIVLDPQKAEVLFADMTWHRQSHEILDRIRVFCERERKRVEVSDNGSAPFAHHGTHPPIFEFHPPASLAAGSVLAGNVYSRIYLPVDSELETNAHKWLASNNKDLRWLGARAMIYFKSAENAAVLRTMLADDAAWGRIDMLHMMGLSHPYNPKYLVRWEAWHTLVGWGYEAPQPRF